MGVFISEGMRLRIPVGGLTLDLNSPGGLSSNLMVEVLLDVWPYWLDVGMDHAAQAREARHRLESLDPEDGERVGLVLGEECRASMVAMSAAAFALDGFHAAIRRHADMSSLALEWSRAGTPRYARVFELMRRSFRMSNANAKEARAIVKELFRFRDWAVHPPADFNAPVLHEVLRRGVEWRFVAFNAPNSQKAITNAAKLIHFCLERPRVDSGVADWSSSASELLKVRWDRAQDEFGAEGPAA